MGLLHVLEEGLAHSLWHLTNRSLFSDTVLPLPEFVPHASPWRLFSSQRLNLFAIWFSHPSQWRRSTRTEFRRSTSQSRMTLSLGTMQREGQAHWRSRPGPDGYSVHHNSSRSLWYTWGHGTPSQRKPPVMFHLRSPTDVLRQKHVLCPQQRWSRSMVLELHHRTRRCPLPGRDVRRDGVHPAHRRGPVLLDVELLPSQLQAFPHLDARVDDLDRLVQTPADPFPSFTDWLMLFVRPRLRGPSCQLS